VARPDRRRHPIRLRRRGGLFAFAAITDFFDGFLARRWKRVTVLGNFLDTTADKLLVSGVLIALVAVGRASRGSRSSSSAVSC